MPNNQPASSGGGQNPPAAAGASDGPYISAEIRDWLARLATQLPASAARPGHRDGDLNRADLLEEIGTIFAPYMSTGPAYSRGVTEYVQNAVRRFSKGDGGMAGDALRRAHQVLAQMPGQPGSAASSPGRAAPGGDR